MCFYIRNNDMLDWLRMQVRVLEAWREQVATAPELDIEMITRLEEHYQWLTREIYQLESLRLERSQAA